MLAGLEEEMKPKLTNKDDIELETTLQELMLNLLGDRVETDIRRGADFFSHFLLPVSVLRGSHWFFRFHPIRFAVRIIEFGNLEFIQNGVCRSMRCHEDIPTQCDTFRWSTEW